MWRKKDMIEIKVEFIFLPEGSVLRFNGIGMHDLLPLCCVKSLSVIKGC